MFVIPYKFCLIGHCENANFYLSGNWQQSCHYLKKIEQHLASNYRSRPISLLSVVSKIFERIVHKYLHNFVMENQLLYKYQSGFVSGHSTVFQMLQIFHKICTSLEERNQTCMVFFLYIESIRSCMS